MKYTSIDELVKDDKKWRKLSLKICQDELLADDIVHIFYENYMNLKNPPEFINIFYIQNAFRNIFLKNKKKTLTYNDGYSISEIDQNYYNYDATDDIINQNLYDNMMDNLDDIEWFHKKLFEIVMIEGISIRQLEKRTGLSFSTIQQSVAKTKEFLKNKHSDEKEN